MTEGYDVFISYRRETGAAEARLIRLALMEKGKRTFLDVTDLRGGFFDEALLGYIAAAPNFVLILSPGSLDRCATDEDWFRREIAHALRSGANIVPVFVPGFAFPPQLPEDLRNLPRHQGVDYSHRYFDAMVEEIVRVCRSANIQPPPPPPPLPVREPPPAVAPAAAPPRPRPPSKQTWTGWVIAGGVAVALILGGIYYVEFYRTPPVPRASPDRAPASAAISPPVDKPAATTASPPPASPSSSEPSRPEAASLIGTKWEIDGNPYTTEFLAGGAMNLVDVTVVDHAPPRSWTQTGDHVSIHMPFVSYEMTVSGDEMSGTQQVLKSPVKPAKARRVR